MSLKSRINDFLIKENEDYIFYKNNYEKLSDDQKSNEKLIHDLKEEVSRLKSQNENLTQALVKSNNNFDELLDSTRTIKNEVFHINNNIFNEKKDLMNFIKEMEVITQKEYQTFLKIKKVLENFDETVLNSYSSNENKKIYDLIKNNQKLIKSLSNMNKKNTKILEDFTSQYDEEMLNLNKKLYLQELSMEKSSDQLIQYLEKESKTSEKISER